MNRSTNILLIVIAGLLTAGPALAQDDSNQLRRILQGQTWGIAHQEVLDFYRSNYLADYQDEIAGERDTIRIDQVRQHHNQRFARIQNSYEDFTEPRTGYEVSVLAGEVVGQNGESMLTVRTENAQLYYLFASDQLFKVVVAYNSAYLGELQFEAFLDQVERRYGPPSSTAMDETAAGIRFMARAVWEEGDTRLRVENRSNLFGTFTMVFTSIDLERAVENLRGERGRHSAAVAVSPLVNALSEGDGARGNSNVADSIIGRTTEVELIVPEAAPVDLTTVTENTDEDGMTEEEAEAAAQAEAEAAEEEAAARRRRQRERERREREEEEEGITIY